MNNCHDCSVEITKQSKLLKFDCGCNFAYCKTCFVKHTTLKCPVCKTPLKKYQTM